MTEPIIHLHNLSYTYEGQARPALHNVNFSVYPGEWVTIVGPGGSGKSTLCALLSGALQSWPRGTIAGVLWVDGKDWTHTTALETSGRIGIVYPDPEFTLIQQIVEDELAFGPENLCVAPDEIETRIDEALEAVGMSDARNKRTHQLSGGQQQRIAVASVLTMKPSILVLDNAYGNLDQPSIERLTDTLLAMQRRGHTIVTTSSRLDSIVPVGRAILLEEGVIAAQEDAKEAARKHKHTAEKIGVLPSCEPADAITPISGHRSSAPVVSVNRLHYAYRSDDRPALYIEEMKLHKGSIVSIMGPNGSGKTTFGKLIAGLLSPPQGTLFVKERDLVEVPMHERLQLIGYVFQKPEHQFVADTVWEECFFGLPPQERRLKEQWLERFGLLLYKEDNPHQLPIAQKRLLNVASATIRQPDILLLDEPTAGLDYRAANSIMKHCADYAKQGKLVIMMTHDEAMANQWSDEKIVFRRPALNSD